MARLVPKIYPLDVDENVPIGVSFPLTVGTPKQNFLTSSQVHDNLRNLILTMKGERPMQPTFGSDLYAILFEQAEEGVLQTACKDAIDAAVAMWMPQVVIQDVDVTSDIDRYLVNVAVKYVVEGWPADNVLNLKVKV